MMAPKKRRHNFYVSDLLLYMALAAATRQLVSASMSPDNEYETNTDWEHVDLDEDFRVSWTIKNLDITFEIEARTLGYVGFGFSQDGHQAGADVAVGWVDGGHTFFQDRYVERNGTPEPLVDPSQDYVLIRGYENRTHTVMRFRRKLDTCDHANDIVINTNTMRVMFMYHDEDPPHGSVTPGSLPNPTEAWRPYRSLLLLQRPSSRFTQNETTSRTLELRNGDVELPYGDDSLFWCKVFRLDKLERKQHLIKYEPLFDSSWSIHYLRQITLFECPEGGPGLEEMAVGPGQLCMGARSLPLSCNAIVASWTRGSDGFVFPPEAGYPMDPQHAKFYLMETHYNNLNAEFEPFHVRRMTDNSGLKLVITHHLRPHDVGVLSIGLEPNWRHVIPPDQERVISQGHCVEECTNYAFPPQGISIFAVKMRTHQIGREVRLRQIRNGEEYVPIAQDSNVDSSYQEFHRLSQPVRSLPGDRLVAECVYDSSSRMAITLGGLSMKEEACVVLALYYPRQSSLTTCHSLPSLPTVLHSLGIEQLTTNSNPVVIAAPLDLAGMMLETRLLSYDWKHQFEKFQAATLLGSFKPICKGAHNEVVPTSEHLVGHNKKVVKRYKEPRRCKAKRPFVMETIRQLELPVLPGSDRAGDRDSDSNYIASEVSVRSSRSSFVETLALSGSQSSSVKWLTLLGVQFVSLLTLLGVAS